MNPIVLRLGIGSFAWLATACAHESSNIEDACAGDACRPAISGKADRTGFDWSAPVQEGLGPQLHAFVHKPIELRRNASHAASHYFIGGRESPRQEDTAAAACYLSAARPMTLQRVGPFRIEDVFVFDSGEDERVVSFRFLENPEGLDSLLCVKSRFEAPITYGEVRDALRNANDGAFVYFEEQPPPGDHG